jgi:hypothetical protein
MTATQIDTGTAISLENRIRNAYQQIQNERGNPTNRWVSLTELRPYVGGYREQVDQALILMGRCQDVDIVPENNQKTLTQWDWDAALWMGNQWKHLIQIG